MKSLFSRSCVVVYILFNCNLLNASENMCPQFYLQSKSGGKFLSSLEMAIDDLKNFETVHGKDISAKAAFFDIIDGLKSLESPKLVNRFTEKFIGADQLTRQYMLDQIVRLEPLVPAGITFRIRGRLDKTKEGLDPLDVLKQLLEKPMEELQEEAYFDYRSAGISRRPILKDTLETNTAAMRFLARHNYDLSNPDVLFAASQLVKSEIADESIAESLVKVLTSRKLSSVAIKKEYDASYMAFELKVLERNLVTSTPVEVNYEHTARVLSEKTNCHLCLEQILDLHAQGKLKQIPILSFMAQAYFRNYSESFSELSHEQKGKIEQFRNEFGI